MCMQRMHILLPSELRQKIRLRAEQDSKPQNEVVRELLEKGLSAERPRSTGDAMLRLVDLGKRLGVAGPKDWASRHDEYFAKEV
jgi:plasmid stability protein